MVRVPRAQLSPRLCCKADLNNPSDGGTCATNTCQMASSVCELSDSNGAAAVGIAGLCAAVVCAAEGAGEDTGAGDAGRGCGTAGGVGRAAATTGASGAGTTAAGLLGDATAVPDGAGAEARIGVGTGAVAVGTDAPPGPVGACSRIVLSCLSTASKLVDSRA